MKRLELAQFPLDGLRLIEASAGTGKTYTIAALYLRHLLERGLPVTQLLVVTFTEAATQELRGRIRQRLLEALAWLEGRSEQDPLADLLQPWRGQPAVLQQLRDALTRMDEAAVFTIHGFCQRMLVDAAFESGTLFEAEFVTDEHELRLQAIQDFWRREVVAAPAERAARVLAQWSGPEQLLDAIKALLGSTELAVEPRADDAQLQALQQQLQSLQTQFCAQWQQDAAAIKSLLLDAPVLSRSKSKGYAKERLLPLFDWLEHATQQALLPLRLPAEFRLLSRSTLNASDSLKPSELKKGSPVPQHPAFELAEQLLRCSTQLAALQGAAFQLQAADYVRAAVTRRKEAERILFFDDLLSRLDTALAGPGGAALAQRIRTLFPVAMIDEFQDTDSMQYRIFHRIYHAAAGTALYLIGDPKQAIYSFRGGDIFTYMQARHDTDAACDHFTLDTNHRSHSALVQAVNTVFANTDAAFLYPGEIDFHPAQAAGRADATPLLIDGKPVAPLVCWLVDNASELASKGTVVAKKTAYPLVAAACAAEVAALLDPAAGACIGTQPVRAGDIAILVRNHIEAAAVRSALAEARIGSVYISRDSVFATEEAQELLQLLRAIAQPGSAVLLRTALATRLLGCSAAAIHALTEDEAAWDARVQALQDYRRDWQRFGFMRMFRELLRAEGISARLLALPDGERRMTNLLQLAELAQEASLHKPGLEPLLRWLAEARLAADGNNEAQQLRLESDENLVQIVTIHKSKGLQYGIVFVPFVWSARRVKDSGILLYNAEADGQRVADLGSPTRSAALRLAEKQRLAEDLRLLYVAFTRARYRCYFSWGHFNGAADSALAWLLHPPAEPDLAQPQSGMARLADADLRQALQQLPPVQQGLLALQELPAPGRRLPQAAALQQTLAPRRFTGDTHCSLQTTSFSNLVQSAAHERSWQVELPDHDQLQAADSTPDEPAGHSAYSFPRGVRAGLLLHQVFEQLDFPAAGGPQLGSVVTAALEQYGFAASWQGTLERWIGAVLDTPLDGSGLCLRRITTDRRLVELAFHFPVTATSARALNALLQRSRGSGRATPSLDFATLSGMLKGFIDLVIEHEGRFFVLDYKSNHLGNSSEDYAAARLPAAIDAHDYDLQYLIYMVALHRYLGQRLPDYDYERHIGGVYYLFLRGMHPANPAGTGIFHERPPLALIDALDRIFAGAQTHG